MTTTADTLTGDLFSLSERTHVAPDVGQRGSVGRQAGRVGERMEAAQSVPLPYQAHSPTSRAAAQSLRGQTGTLRCDVLVWLRTHGPATDERLADAFPERKEATVRARRVELVRMRLVRDSGQKALMRSGRDAVVWEAIETP